MKFAYWARRVTRVFGTGFLVLLGYRLLREDTLAAATGYAAFWAAAASMVFLVWGIYYVRRGRSCEVCDVSPEGADGSPPSPVHRS